jgi:ArsR family transcriptional regulator
MKKAEKRLQRFVESNVCNADNADIHIEELKETARDLMQRTGVREKSKFFKALSDEKRLGIVKLLSIRDMCICELMIALDVSQSNLSHHVKILENAGIIDRIKKGKWVFCTLADRGLVERMTSIDLL